MKILNLKNVPSVTELSEILKREFSGDYSYKFFGLDREKSIMVGKSLFVGVQISKRENEITVQGIHSPSASSSFFSFLDLLGTGGALIGIFGSSVKKLEKEITLFLKNKYE